MSVPDNIRQEVCARLWKAADELDWFGLPAAAKTKHYDRWTEDSRIGGRLSRFLPHGEVRHYLKDALIKVYCRERQAAVEPILRLVGLSSDTPVERRYIKPHGCELNDGRVICWGQANSWKLVVLSLYERCFGDTKLVPFAVVLTHAAAHFGEEAARPMVDEAARKLGIQKTVWRL